MLLLCRLDVTGAVHLTAFAVRDVSLSQLPASTAAVSSALEHRDVSTKI